MPLDQDLSWWRYVVRVFVPMNLSVFSGAMFNMYCAVRGKRGR